MEPTISVAVVLFAADGENSESVAVPAGSEPITMKISAETTSAQPAMKPSAGCSARATHE